MTIFRRQADGSLVNPDGATLRTHQPLRSCLRDGCVIHSPTKTSIAYIEDWPLNWRSDRGFMEVLCPCGVGHPAYDQINYWMRTLPPHEVIAQMVHGCCGHCDYNTQDMEEEDD